MNDILMDREALDLNSLISSLRLQSWSCCLTPCAPAATAGSARRLPCSCSTRSNCSTRLLQELWILWMRPFPTCLSSGNTQTTFSPIPFEFSLLRTRFYGKWAKSTCATHQGNSSPNKIVIFLAFFKNMDSQNTVLSIGFQSLFIHIFSIFHHCYLVSKISHHIPAKIQR